jgi:peptidoglycan hydrolase CwlO-like protein
MSFSEILGYATAIVTIILTIFQFRKIKGEAKLSESSAIESISRAAENLVEQYRKESDSLRLRNKELEEIVELLQNKLKELTEEIEKLKKDSEIKRERIEKLDKQVKELNNSLESCLKS